MYVYYFHEIVLFRCGAGAPVGWANFSHGLEQCLLHAHLCRRPGLLGKSSWGMQLSVGKCLMSTVWNSGIKHWGALWDGEKGKLPLAQNSLLLWGTLP